MMYHLRAAWWKLRPPPIPSPYLHDPKFARALEDTLATMVYFKKHIICFGHLHGWTTDIIKRNTKGAVEVYDINNAEGTTYLNIWHWIRQPTNFDFMYVDVGNTEGLLIALWQAVQREISSGSLVVFEGATRMRLTIPHKVIISRKPGLGKLLP